MSANSPSQGLTKRTGTISNYKVQRAAASFVFTDSDQTKLGVIAIAASLAWLGGQAVATASYVASAEEDADYVEFDLDGQPVKGWVWRSPFKNGDEVEVVGEANGSYLEAAAVARPVDRIIAIYPHCSRGSSTHIKNAVKWWLIGCCLFNMLVTGVMLTIVQLSKFIEDIVEPMTFMAIGVFVFFGLMVVSLARKWMPFVHVAEKVFRELGWPNPGDIDLLKSSKAQRRPDDPGEFGTFYFRY